MAFCERLSEQLAIVATIDPIACTAVDLSEPVFSMALHRRALFILQTGAAFGQATVLIQENAAFAFTAATATLLTGLVTDITEPASQYLFEVSAEAMGDGMEYLRASLAGMTPTDVISMVVLADVERYHPGSDQNLLTTVIAGVAN